MAPILTVFSQITYLINSWRISLSRPFSALSDDELTLLTLVVQHGRDQSPKIQVWRDPYVQRVYYKNRETESRCLTLFLCYCKALELSFPFLALVPSKCILDFLPRLIADVHLVFRLRSSAAICGQILSCFVVLGLNYSVPFYFLSGVSMCIRIIPVFCK